MGPELWGIWEGAGLAPAWEARELAAGFKPQQRLGSGIPLECPWSFPAGRGARPALRLKGKEAALQEAGGAPISSYLISKLPLFISSDPHHLPLCLQIQLFSGPDCLGDHISFDDDQASLPVTFQPQSCRVHGGR